MKMTFQPKKRSHAKVHGFRARMSTKGGRKVLAAKVRFFGVFLTPLQKLDIIRIILRNSRFVKFFFMFFIFLLQKSYPQLIPKVSTVFSLKNVVDKSYPQIVDNLCITLGII